MAIKRKRTLRLIAVLSIGAVSVLAPGPSFVARAQNFLPPQRQEGQTGRPNQPNQLRAGPRQGPDQFPRDDQPRRQRDRPKWWANEQRAQQRQQRLQRGREIARRLMNDPNAPASIKERAQRLDSTLIRVEDLERELQHARAAFLRQHQGERAELRGLKERMDRIRQDLKAAREQAKADNLSKLQEIKRSTEEARTLAQELRGYYRQQRTPRPYRYEDE